MKLILSEKEVGKRWQYFNNDERIPFDFGDMCVIEITHVDKDRHQLTGRICYVDAKNYKELLNKEVTWNP